VKHPPKLVVRLIWRDSSVEGETPPSKESVAHQLHIFLFYRTLFERLFASVLPLQENVLHKSILFSLIASGNPTQVVLQKI
jgi:hypothetical protein